MTARDIVMAASGNSSAPSVTFNLTTISATTSNMLAGDEPSWAMRTIYSSIVVGGVYYIVGSQQDAISTNTFATAYSSDGINWTVSTSLMSVWPSTQTGKGVLAHNGSVFVIGGSNGYLATSTDGITWTSNTSLRTNGWGTSYEVVDIIWNGTIFVAVGTNGRVATSSDGITWTNYTSNLTGTTFGTANPISITWTGTAFVVAGTGAKIATSADGINWSVPTSDYSTVIGTSNILKLKYAGTTLWAMGNSGKLFTSSDQGSTWYNSTAISSLMSYAILCDIAFNGTYYIIANRFGSAFFFSSDGLTWTNRQITDFNSGQTGSYGDGVLWNSSSSKWFIFSASASLTATATTLATSWTVGYQISKYLDLTCGIVDGSSYLIGTSAASIYKYNPQVNMWYHYASLKNSSWSVGSPQIKDIIKVGSLYIAVGNNSKCATSTDGINWTPNGGLVDAFSNSGISMNKLAYGNGLFMAVGNSGKIATSTDGITWTNRSVNTTDFNTYGIKDVCFGNGKFLVIAKYSVATSTDGVTWNIVDISSAIGTESTLQVCTHTGDAFVAASGRKSAVSIDGVTWLGSNTISPTSYMVFSTMVGTSSYLLGGAISNSGNAYYLVSSDSPNFQSWVLSGPGISTYNNYTRIFNIGSDQYIALATRWNIRKFTKV